MNNIKIRDVTFGLQFLPVDLPNILYLMRLFTGSKMGLEDQGFQTYRQQTHNVLILSFACINSLRPRPNRRHFAYDIFKCIFENENEWITPRMSLKFVPKVRINNIPALVQIMAWRRPGDKPLSEPMMVSLPTHICVTRPQWVKIGFTPSDVVNNRNWSPHPRL